jgi:hypothetical protein
MAEAERWLDWNPEWRGDGEIKLGEVIPAQPNGEPCKLAADLLPTAIEEKCYVNRWEPTSARQRRSVCGIAWTTPPEISAIAERFRPVYGKDAALQHRPLDGAPFFEWDMCAGGNDDPWARARVRERTQRAETMEQYRGWVFHPSIEKQRIKPAKSFVRRDDSPFCKRETEARDERLAICAAQRRLYPQGEMLVPLGLSKISYTPLVSREHTKLFHLLGIKYEWASKKRHPSAANGAVPISHTCRPHCDCGEDWRPFITWRPWENPPERAMRVWEVMWQAGAPFLSLPLKTDSVGLPLNG